MKIEKIIDLWIHENSIANSKASYYFGSLTILAWPVAQLTIDKEFWLGFFFSSLGVLFSILFIFSINRTLKYRETWRAAIDSNGSEYTTIFRDAQQSARRSLFSSVSLKTLPVLGGVIYFFVSIYQFCKAVSPYI